MPFIKGQSGNPAGRPVGSRNRFTREMDEALEQRGVPLIDSIANHAHAANPAAMRLCLDRLVPTGKNRPATIELPPVETPDYTLAALGEIHRALGAGEISTDEATRLVGFVDRTTRVLASKAVAEVDLADRLARCEEALAKCMALLGMPAPAGETAAVAASPAPEAAETAAAALAIANNNAKTMEPAAAGEAAPAPSDAPPPARRSRGAAISRLTESTSPLAHGSGATPGKTMPAMPPPKPLADAA
jgi:hypothetical protein